ncbi:receptor-like protein EIX2 [Lactuca sativa]|uniref:receptor-like protein EIX2 n=1 Tax=Lactuca sativa TaxID=4236 RepID=UPI000CD95F63|nr:receptor-like protein EIX2 [Lactuca sativa]
MNNCVFIIFSYLLLFIVTTTASQLVAVGEGGDDTNNGVMKKKCWDKERDALLLFKAPLQDNPIDTLSTWTEEDDECCKWSGVICSNPTGHVTGLDIKGYDLRGEISRSLLNLTYLDYLDLFYNSLHGTIPTFIGSLTRLRYLDLSYNNLNGTIPRSIGSLSELRHLNLGRNNLNGTIPTYIGSMTRLRHLDLSSNSLYGTIPPEFGNLTNLQQLNLRSDNGGFRVENIEWLSHLSHLEELYMDGISLSKQNHWVNVILSLPKLSILSLQGCELSQVMYPYSSFLNSSSSSIESLYLVNNSLTSSMYRWLFPLTSNKLHELSLSYNMLDGIPKYLGNLCSLETLYFDNNSAVVKFPDFLNNLSGCTSNALKRLSASYNQFTGSLSREIRKFSSLEHLDLSNNLLNGNIHDLFDTGISDTTPQEFAYMWPSQLKYLNLSSNNISGKVPDLSSNFANRSVIDLSSNSFSGPVPNVPSTLSSLNLSKNKFSGGISFICQIVDGFLSFLDLSHNSLSGKLPDCLWHFKHLEVLNLGHNNLFGRLPPSIGSLIELKVLYLYKNDFSGDLPLPLKNCTSLISLNLGANKFSGNVPVSIGENLTGLYVLILRSNNFFGTIPLQLCQLANLQILDLSLNNLHGTIPSCLSNLTRMVQPGFTQDAEYYRFITDRLYRVETYVDHAMIKWQGDEREFISTLKLLKIIDLSSNNLTGQMPYEITNLYDLIALNLSKNALSGEIPQKIGEIKNLLTLDLSRNRFSGRIPSSMSQMSLLNDLDLSFNNLSGRIPISTQLQSFQPSRYNGNARLCGPPLTKSCPGDEESKAPPLIGKSEGDEEDIDELWGWFYIGGGMGFATGFWIKMPPRKSNRRFNNTTTTPPPPPPPPPTPMDIVVFQVAITADVTAAIA